MFVLIDFCGVRSLGTGAYRPALHLEFKECSGRSAPVLFVLYRTTTSSGNLHCQQRGWQRSQSVCQSLFYLLSQSPNQCSLVTLILIHALHPLIFSLILILQEHEEISPFQNSQWKYLFAKLPTCIATHLVNQSQSKLTRDEDQRDDE